jgi:hypothetical protein
VLALAAAGGRIAPWAFVALVAGAVLAQLLLEAFTVRPERRRYGSHRHPLP